jgi:hypothetical protein
VGGHSDAAGQDVVLATVHRAMLFAIVALRNFLPGNPPLGSWIDQAVVLWVLIGLVVAMALFILAWWRHRDRKQPKKTRYRRGSAQVMASTALETRA